MISTEYVENLIAVSKFEVKNRVEDKGRIGVVNLVFKKFAGF